MKTDLSELVSVKLEDIKALQDALKQCLNIWGRGYEPKEGVEDTVGSRLYVKCQKVLQETNLEWSPIEDIRTKAIAWWGSLPDNGLTINPDNSCIEEEKSKYKLADKYHSRHWMSLTGREIEFIYRLENK